MVIDGHMGTSKKSKLPGKAELKRELVEVLNEALATLERAQQDAMIGATHAEAKPENDKDTRALEQSYLARGQAARVEELRVAAAEGALLPVRDFDEDSPIALGALVTVEEGDKLVHMLIARHGGGTRLAKGMVQVVTTRSPLGAALLGKRLGDVCEVSVAGKLRTLEIVDVA